MKQKPKENMSLLYHSTSRGQVGGELRRFGVEHWKVQATPGLQPIRACSAQWCGGLPELRAGMSGAELLIPQHQPIMACLAQPVE